MNCMYNRRVIRCRVKRTQALVETTLPGIARSTEVLRRSDGCPVSRYHGSTSGAMPPKTQSGYRFVGFGVASYPSDQYGQPEASSLLNFVSEISGPFQNEGNEGNEGK
jgi:hypothetical protein